jgi:error-prone DNA polymerase
MRHALDEIARTEHVKVDLDAIALDDEPTFELIRASDTLGCFQIESPGQRELLQKLQPTRWDGVPGWNPRRTRTRRCDPRSARRSA